jgi:4-aminobutyrate aminotransferase/(S)-3-amino-2-methylpropionate transaminase
MHGVSNLPPEVRGPVPGARGAELVEALATSECPALTTRRARRSEHSRVAHDPIVWTRASGINVWDADDNRYVDMTAGFGAAAVGHSHPEVLAAIAAQSERLLHALGDVHPSDVKVRLLQRLARLSPFDDARVILGLSGSDAVTAALKTAVLATGRPGILAFEGGYHGLGYGPLAACGYHEGFRAPFASQLNPHVRFAPYPRTGTDVGEAVRETARAWDVALRDRTEIGAVLVEAVLGRGGIVVPPPGFLRALGELARARGALLIADEIQTGLGRAGAWFRSTADGAAPDLVCLGKALGGGLAISACIGPERVMRAWGDPAGEAIHTGTFFGQPLACAAALATLDVMEREALATAAADKGRAFQAMLAGLRAHHACVREVRGAGLMVGVELDGSARALAVVRALLERGYIALVAGTNGCTVSLTAPLTISETRLTEFVHALDATLEATA